MVSRALNHDANQRYRSMKLLQQLWRDEDGVVVTSDFVLLSTILLTGTIVGIFVVRTATLKLFVNVAVGMSRQQTHEFDKDERTAEDDAKSSAPDGVYGYEVMATKGFPFGEDEGETPEEINIAPAQPEGSTSYGGGSGG
jgi:hypothetical protein